MKMQPYTATDGSTVEINYDEDTNLWGCELNEERITAESLLKLREKIDRRLSPKAKARKIPCFTQEYSHLPVAAVATSITERGGYIRVTVGGDRKQVNRNYIFSDTPANRKVIAEMEVVGKERDALSKKYNALGEKLARFDVKQLED